MRPLLLLTLCLPLPAQDAAVWIEKGRFRAAHAILERALQSGNQNPETYFFLSKTKAAFGDLEGAIAAARRAVELEPRNAACRAQLGGLRLIQARYRMPDAVLAKPDFQAALEWDPKNAEALSGLAKILFLEGDRDNAANTAARIPSPEKAMLARLDLLELANDKPGLTALHTEAAAQFPDSFEVQWRAAFHFIDAGRTEAAARLARSAIRIAPDRQQGYAILVRCLILDKKFDALDALLDEAAAKVPNDGNPLFQAARELIIQSAEPARAEKYLRRFQTLPPEGFAPAPAVVWWRLGQALAQQNKIEDARKAFDAALAANPRFEAARREREKLR
ncbi:MAG: tetratricopeptide repeat protein [Bryobacteraceae bacterium]|nr:tetratricopeptide repeat protein [Bryobacteraceae bacterium]